MRTIVRARIPGTACRMEVREVHKACAPLMLVFLRNRGFTEVERLVEDIPLNMTEPVGQEAAQGFYPWPS